MDTRPALMQPVGRFYLSLSTDVDEADAMTVMLLRCGFRPNVVECWNPH